MIVIFGGIKITQEDHLYQSPRVLDAPLKETTNGVRCVTTIQTGGMIWWTSIIPYVMESVMRLG